MPFVDHSSLVHSAMSAFPVRKWLDQDRAPTSADYRNFQIFDIWIYQGQSAWIMIDRSVSSGTWVQFSSSGTGILTITGDSVGAIAGDGANNINLLTGAHLSLAGNPGTNTLTLTLDADLAATYTSGVGVATPAAGNLNILGSAGLTTSGAGSTITVTAGTTIPTSFVTDAGTATPTLNALNILGGILCETAAVENTITVNLDSTVANTYMADSGSAIPSENKINIVGIGGISTSGSGETITITSSGGGVGWTEITAVKPTQMIVDRGYITNHALPVQLLLPLTAPLGATIIIVWKGLGGWLIIQNAGQSILVGASASTVGVTGTVGSSEAIECVELVCITANTTWRIRDSNRNLVIT